MKLSHRLRAIYTVPLNLPKVISMFILYDHIAMEKMTYQKNMKVKTEFCKENLSTPSQVLRLQFYVLKKHKENSPQRINTTKTCWWFTKSRSSIFLRDYQKFPHVHAMRLSIMGKILKKSKQDRDYHYFSFSQLNGSIFVTIRTRL